MKNFFKTLSFVLIISALSSCEPIAGLFGLELGDVKVEMTYKGDIEGKFKSKKIASEATIEDGRIKIIAANANIKGDVKSVVIILPEDIEPGDYHMREDNPYGFISFAFGLGTISSEANEDSEVYMADKEYASDFNFTITINDDGVISGKFKGEMNHTVNSENTIQTDGKFHAVPTK